MTAVVPPEDGGRGWDYDTHPGDCHERREPDGTWTVCCRECAGTGVFPVPWISSPAEGQADPDASCVRCKGTGRAVVGLSAPTPEDGGNTAGRDVTREDRAVATGLMRRARAAETPDEWDAARDAIAHETASERSFALRDRATPPAPVPDPQREQIAQTLLTWAKAIVNPDGAPSPYELADELLSLMAADPLRQRVEAVLAMEPDIRPDWTYERGVLRGIELTKQALRRALGTEAGDRP